MLTPGRSARRVPTPLTTRRNTGSCLADVPNRQRGSVSGAPRHHSGRGGVFAAEGALQRLVGGRDLSWTLNAYTVLYAALLVPAGRLADLNGHKRVFLQGLALFSFASTVCAWAPDIGTLIAARALQANAAADCICRCCWPACSVLDCLPSDPRGETLPC